jgi:hypothetical protein
MWTRRPVGQCCLGKQSLLPWESYETHKYTFSAIYRVADCGASNYHRAFKGKRRRVNNCMSSWSTYCWRAWLCDLSLRQIAWNLEQQSVHRPHKLHAWKTSWIGHHGATRTQVSAQWFSSIDCFKNLLQKLLLLQKKNAYARGGQTTVWIRALKPCARRYGGRGARITKSNRANG